MGKQQQTATQQVIGWMEEEASWYSDHREFPVLDLATEANRRFDFHGQFSEDWAEFMSQKRYGQAKSIFRRLGLSMNEDAEK